MIRKDRPCHFPARLQPWSQPALPVGLERDHAEDVRSHESYLAQGRGGAGLGCCAFLAAP